MDEVWIRSVLMPAHGLAGLVALVSGYVALIARKRGSTHRLPGRIFAVALLTAIGISIPVIALRSNIFLTGLGAMSVYFVVSGWWMAVRRGRAPTAVDLALPGAAILGFLGFALWGATYLARGVVMGAVPIALGGLGAWIAWGHLVFARGKDERTWLHHHGVSMGSAVIASTTAFAIAALGDYLPDAWEWAVWLAPTPLLVPVLQRQLRRGVA